jgi:hypothetical protein
MGKTAEQSFWCDRGCGTMSNTLRIVRLTLIFDCKNDASEETCIG